MIQEKHIVTFGCDTCGALLEITFSASPTPAEANGNARRKGWHVGALGELCPDCRPDKEGLGHG